MYCYGRSEKRQYNMVDSAAAEPVHLTQVILDNTILNKSSVLITYKNTYL